jgi:putative flippase GtrA
MKEIQCMIKRYSQIFGQWIRYVCTGVSSFVLDIVLLIVAKEYLGFSPVVAIIWTQVLVMCYNFTLNNKWSFQRQKKSYSTEVSKYLCLAVCNYVVGIGCMYIGHHIFGIDYRIVRIATVGLIACWNFFLYKYWVFREQVHSSVYNISSIENNLRVK